MAMINHELAMAAFAKLARISYEKNQPVGCDRFLSLTAKSACCAGVLTVAERCRDLVAINNAHHVLAKANSCVEAVRDKINAAFFQSLDRFCSFERAEFLLQNLDESAEVTNAQAAAESELAQIRRA